MGERAEDTPSGGGPRRGVSRVIGRVAPTVLRQIDLDEVIAQIDVNAIAEDLDLDALMARIDLDQLVERLDVEAIARRLDMNEIAARLDIQAVANRLDMNEIAEQLDIDAIVARVDVEAILDRLDINAVAERLDLDQLMGRIDMAQLTAGATQDVAVSGLDLARRQLMRADRTVDRMSTTLLRRPPADRPRAPGALENEIVPAPAIETTGADAEVDEADVREARRQVSGHYAGPVTRIVALAGDIAAGFSSFGAVGAVLFYLVHIVTGLEIDITELTWLQQLLVSAWMLTWFWIPTALFGRTPAMALVGVAVLARDGTRVTGRQALVRALVLPVSLLFLGLGLIGILIGRERRALHDVVAGTCVVYDWGARDAEMPLSIRDRLSARVQRRRNPEQPGG